MKQLLLLLAGASVLAAAPAVAQQYTLQASGYINSVGGGPGYTSDGRVVDGDAFSMTISYSTLSVASSTTTVGDDRQTVYTVPATYSYKVGRYSASGSFSSVDLIIGDNHDIGAGQVQDGIAFINFNPPTTDSPFAFGTLPVYTSFQLNSYDPTQSTLNGTDLAQISRYPDMPRRFVYFGFVNSTFDNAVTLFGDVTSSRFYAGGSPVLEPGTWSMMLIGFGMVAGATRHRRRAFRVASI